MMQHHRQTEQDVYAQHTPPKKGVIYYSVIHIKVSVKTKNIEIIRFTTIFNELHFMTGTDIFLPDYSRKHLPIKND